MRLALSLWLYESCVGSCYRVSPSKLCLSFSYVRVFCIVMQHFSKPHGLVVFGGMWGVHQVPDSTVCASEKARTECCPFRTQDSLSNPRRPRRILPRTPSKYFIHSLPRTASSFSKFRKMMRKLSLFFVCQIGKHHDNTLSTLSRVPIFDHR